jgi:phosphate-selective porin OprO/OprP
VHAAPENVTASSQKSASFREDMSEYLGTAATQPYKQTTAMKRIQNTLIATALLCGAQAYAANDNATGLLVGKLVGETPMDQAWSAFNLYKDDANPILQEFSLQGRLQLQTIYGEAGGDSFNTSDYKDAGNDESVWGNDIEARRARFGFKSKWFQNWKLDGQINVDLDGRDGDTNDHTLYKDLYDLFVTYGPSETFNVSAGKTKTRFTREQEISSNNILTIERSLLANTLFPGELTGIWTSGKGVQEYWLYELGVYGSDRVREFSEFDQGAIVLGKVGYDYSSQAGLDSAVASIHYMHNTEPGFAELKETNYTPSTSPDFTDSIALTNDINHGRYGLTTELLYGFGYDGKADRYNSSGTKYGPQIVEQSDVFGITIIPSYFIADGLQLVARLQVATCEDGDDLRVPSRYERLAIKNVTYDKKGKRKVNNDDERGNTYVSTYLGLNYYIHGHKLKLMNGIEYSDMGGGDYDGYTLMSGLRFSF